MFAEQELEKCPVLIVANKHDLKGHLDPEIVEDMMGIKQYEGRVYHVQGTSAVTGYGIKEGLDWIAEVLLKK